MDYIREYRKFIYSHYFAHGLQTSFSILLPSIIGYFAGYLNPGILFSLGALCISSVDTPGPPRHRRNSLVAAAFVIFVSAISMSSYLAGAWLGNLTVLLLVFLLSMLALFGNRASNIGLAGIYALILATEQTTDLQGFIQDAFLFLGGALWYSLIALVSYSFRPFQLIQQALSECIYLTAAYLRTRASFYDDGQDFNKNYDRLIKQQIEVNASQAVVRSLLLKRREATRDSTARGRSLLMILLEIIDIHEQTMAAGIDLHILQTTFSGRNILPSYQHAILSLVKELDQVALAVASGRGSFPKTNIALELERLQRQTHTLRDEMMTRENISAFINLRNVRSNIAQISEKINHLHRYTRFQEDSEPNELDLPAFADVEQYTWERFKSNLGSHSGYFRHAVRVTAAVLAGIVISALFPVQRSYWILFTIVVILKPGFSLSKKRNLERLTGTLAGGLFAIALLIFVKQTLVLFLLLVVCMVITYSVSSLNYALSTFSTTVFLLVFFNFLKPGDFSFVKLRIIDTGIASVIAFASSYFIFPVWESSGLENLMQGMLEANKAYFLEVSEAYTGESFDLNAYKLARKAVYVGTANLGSAFQRMLSEPKRKQVHGELVHQFVVLNHLLSSHIAALASYINQYSHTFSLEAFEQMKNLTAGYLDVSLEVLRGENNQKALSPGSAVLRALSEQLEELRTLRVQELREGDKESSETRQRLAELGLLSEQFRFVFKVSQDILKVCQSISAK